MRQFLVIIVLAGLGSVGACASSDMSFLEPAKPQTQTQHQSAPEEGQTAAATGQPQSLENPRTDQQTADPQATAAADHNADTPAPEPAPDGGAAQGSLAQAGQPATGGAAQGSLSQAAASGPPVDDGKTRIEVKPGGGVMGNVRHEVNEMFGRTTNVRVNEATAIQNEMVVGSWNLSEEDGLRTCSIAFSDSDDNNQVQITPGCSAAVATISEWGVFGEDLLLRDGQNSVIVRLRLSADSWVGFTLANGIPIILTR
ncbi:MAG: AprI/Inh family metalloprotease inhibitor [Fimbriimonadaceae bacterium]|nr:AprI/Inh family metalloprotease inhibitor [Alphaproteobacteria bacterium]